MTIFLTVHDAGDAQGDRPIKDLSWWRPNSVFSRQLLSRAPPGSRVEPFHWSGSTDIASERRAARNIYDFLSQSSLEDDVVIIAHGDGGAIAERALDLAAAKNDPLSRLRTCVAVNPRRAGAQRRRAVPTLSTVAVTFISAAPIAFFALIATTMLTEAQASRFGPALIKGLLYILTLIFLSVIIEFLRAHTSRTNIIIEHSNNYSHLRISKKGRIMPARPEFSANPIIGISCNIYLFVYLFFPFVYLLFPALGDLAYIFTGAGVIFWFLLAMPFAVTPQNPLGGEINLNMIVVFTFICAALVHIALMFTFVNRVLKPIWMLLYNMTAKFLLVGRKNARNRADAVKSDSEQDAPGWPPAIEAALRDAAQDRTTPIRDNWFARLLSMRSKRARARREEELRARAAHFAPFEVEAARDHIIETALGERSGAPLPQ